MIVLNGNCWYSPAARQNTRSNNLRIVRNNEASLQFELWKCPGGAL
jgi:hypothetical protein